MAADILALDAVPVGVDQAQHLEIAVDLARQFSRSCRPGVREPQALIAERTATLPGLDGRKMSKSHGSLRGSATAPALGTSG
jgi:tryptophanyl-tRNA synthetase